MNGSSSDRTARPSRFSPGLTVISDEISQDLSEVGRFLRRFELRGFELRSMFGRAFRDLTPADLAEIRATARGEGWSIHGCATPVFKCTLGNEAERAEHVELFKRSLEAASLLDCGLVRVFTFLREPGPFRPATAGMVADRLGHLFELAEAAGIQVGVENESSCLVGSGPELLELLPRLPKTGGGLIWDPCNILYVEDGGSPLGFFSKIAPRVVHVHVKDATRPRRNNSPGRAGPVPVPVGLGDVGWREHLAEISACGYQGLLSLETHWRVKQIDEALLHLPAGHAFSEGGREASEICLRNLESLCATLP